MRAKHLFVASELGVFESLASGPKPLDELARASGCDATNARIIVDAVTALSTQSPRRGFFEREGDRCRNGPVAQALFKRPRTGGYASVHPVLEPPQLPPLAHAGGFGPAGPRDIRRIQLYSG